MAQKEPIKNFVLHDRHGNEIDFSSLSVVGEVEVILGTNIGEPTANSSYQGGKLIINIDNIKGDGITNIKQTPSIEDGGINVVTITCESGAVYTLQILNGTRGNGITAIETEESEEDGGTNTVTFKTTDNPEGQQFHVKNGKRGNGIASITEQISQEDGGINTHTIHYTDPNVQDSVIRTRNGRTGRPGADRQPVESGDVIIAHGLGYDETIVMSQKSVTDVVNDLYAYIGNEGEELQLDDVGYIASNGEFNSVSGYHRTGLIPVNDGMYIKYIGKIANDLLPCIASYDINEEYQGPLLGGRADAYEEYQEIYIPEGIAFIAVASTDGITTSAILNGGGLTGRIIELEDKAEELEDIEEAVGEEYKVYAYTNEGYINVDGTPNEANGYKRTDLITVSEGDVFEYKGRIGNTKFPCIASYNSEQEYQGALLGGRSNAYEEWQEITIPEGIAFIAAASDTNHVFGLRTNGRGILNRLAVLERKVGGHYLPNEYFGKKINWIGDSIVDGPDFDEIVCEYFGLTKDSEYGINGSTIAVKESDATNRNPISIRYAEMSDEADVIVVSAGTNDYQYDQTPFGQLGDTTYYTFYGALDVLCRGLIAKYPTKLIFFTTPIKRNQGETSSSRRELDTAQDVQNGLGKYLSDYAQAIKEVCAKYSIPVCDLYAESMLNPNMSAQATMFDNAGTHPNDAGRALMARRVRGFMKQLM